MLTFNERLHDLGRERFDAIDRGEFDLPWLLGPCRQKILMVVDGRPGSFLNVSFSQSYFGLAAVLDTLRENPEWWAKFDVTRAHRQIDTFKPDPATDPELHEKYGPHYEGFRFAGDGKPADFTIDDYDQIWLFGARGNPDDVDRLRDDELTVLADWMDHHQGGLFATGDHAELGASLCSRVPRAGTMRRWTTGDGVPQARGANRHDTLESGHDSFYTFNDESDDIPMKTRLKRYHLRGYGRFFTVSAPHPVLCGTRGPIDILPDHPHEGWVNEDDDVPLDRTVLTTGRPEYPTSSSGIQARPEVIAWARVQGDHTTASDLNKGFANGKEFGAIGTYDGHRSDVGRVVVDSTWHHWFDVNLTGRPTDGGDRVDPVSPDDPKALGYLYSPVGRVALSRIQNYFRNVALWLARPTSQRCMFLRVVWGVINRYHLVEQLQPGLSLYELGIYARDAIGRRAGQCAIYQFVHPLLPERFFDAFRVKIPEPEQPPGPFPGPEPCLSCPPWELFETLVIGSISREMLTLAYKYQDNPEGAPEKLIAQCASDGLRVAFKELNTLMDDSQKEAQQFSEGLRAFEKDLPASELFMSDQ